MKAMLLSIGTAAALCLAACDPMFEAGRDGLAGQYRLTAVDGNELPWQLAADSAGTVWTVLGGSLTLGRAEPDRYVLAPGGPRPSRCVHEIPTGAWVDTANVVHLKDGSSYRIAPCGDGPYTLGLTRRYTDAGGTVRNTSDTWTGLYAWGAAPGSDTTTLVTLVQSQMRGSADTTGSKVRLTVAVQHIGVPTSTEPSYTFTRTH